MSLTRSFPFRTSLALALTLALEGCGAGGAAMAGPSMTPPPQAPASGPGSGVQAAAGASMADDARAGGASPLANAAPGSAPKPGSGQTPAAASAKAPNAKTGDVESASLVAYVGDLGMISDAETIAPTLDHIVDIAESLGGHLAGRGDTTVKVKIPSQRFRDGMTAIEKLADVTRRSVTADDVTAEFKDLEVRLDNLRATRKRLEEFLARAANMQDMLTVEQQLERVAKEIDQIQGRMRYLKDATSFSLLSVAIVARPKPAPVEIAVTRDAPPAQPPPARAVSIPVAWLGDLGIGALLDLGKSP